MSFPVRNAHSKSRPVPYSIAEYKIKQIPELKETLTEHFPRMLLRNLPKDCSQSELIPLIPVIPSEIKAIEFLKKVDNVTQVGAAVVQLASYDSLSKAVAMDGRDLRGMAIWAVRDVDGIRTLSFLKNLGHKHSKAQTQTDRQTTVITQEALKTVDISTLNHIKDALSSLSKYDDFFFRRKRLLSKKIIRRQKII